MTTLSRSSIYARMDAKSRYFDPEFPKSIKLSRHQNGAVAWRRMDVERWIDAQAEPQT